MTTRVSSSSSQYSSRSLDETSALLPIETNDENPRPRALAASSRASPRAPLWEAKPIGPGGNDSRANVALTPAAATASPRQFGPSRRAPWERTSSSSRSWRSAPSLPDLGEAGGQHAERPRPPLERLAGHLEHGSGRARRSRPDRRAREARRSSGWRQRLAQAPPIGSRDRHARRSRPRRDCGTPWPRSIRPGPTRRSRRCSRVGRTARATRRRPRGRGCRRARGSSRSARSGTRTSTDPPASVRVTSKPASAKTPSMARFSARTSATKLVDADRPGRGGELLEQPRADALALQRVLDRERDLCRRRIAEARPAGDRHDTLLAVL